MVPIQVLSWEAARGETADGRRVEPLPSRAALQNSRVWGCSFNEAWTPGANPIPSQGNSQQPAPQGSGRWKGAPCHASSSPARRWTEVCFSHSPGLHTFTCRAGAPAASPRPGAPLRPPVLVRYPQPQNSLEFFATCRLSKSAWISGQLSSLDQPPAARGLKHDL